MNITVSNQTAIAQLPSAPVAQQPAKTSEKPSLSKNLIGLDSSELKAAGAGALVGGAAVYLPIVGFANVMKPWIGGSFKETLIMPFQDKGLASAVGIGAGVGALAGMAAASNAKSVGEGALRGGLAGAAMGAFAGGTIGTFLEGRPSLAGAMYTAIRGAAAGAVVGAASGMAATAAAR